MFYWNYYDDNFDWNDEREPEKPDLVLTRRLFREQGYSDLQAESLLRSGFVILREAETLVMDRFHAGSSRSADFRSRVPLPYFAEWLETAPCSVNLQRATSGGDARSKLSEWPIERGKRLLFRGQTRHHVLPRERSNPVFSLPDRGEPSLLPSLWRKLVSSRPESFMNFAPPMFFEWQRVLSYRWPIEEVEKRVLARNAIGGRIHSYQDMAESRDPLLEEYGRLQLGLAGGEALKLGDLLNTLLQHYGMLSPTLDLTRDLDVALFFATHELVRNGQGSRYEYVGSNLGKSVIYVFEEDANEMDSQGHQRLLELVKPLRPLRQSCVVCRCASLALNLAATRLVGVMELDGEQSGGRYGASDLFPGEDQDPFLRALRQHSAFASGVTLFDGVGVNADAPVQAAS